MKALKHDNEALRKQAHETKQAQTAKYQDLKHKYRVLHDTFLRVDESRKEYKDVIVDQKKTIKGLKKKLRYYKDRLRQHCGGATNIEEHTFRALSPESHTKRVVVHKLNDNKVDKHKNKSMAAAATAVRDEDSRRSQRRAATDNINNETNKR